MYRQLGPKIKKLKLEGKTVIEITKMLRCAPSTVSYHLYDKTKQSTAKRAKKPSTKANKLKYNHTPHGILTQKYQQFFRVGNGKNKYFEEKKFSMNDFKNFLLQKTHCYLSGRKLNFNNPKGFSVDHVTPRSRGGTNELNNLGVCALEVNISKNNFTPKEYIQLCKEVLEFNGYKVEKLVD